MATFNIGSQQARKVQQADTIYSGHQAGAVFANQVRDLRHEFDRFAEANQVDPVVRAEVAGALDEASSTNEGQNRLTALTRAANSAAGVAVLGGFVQAINSLITQFAK